MVTGLCNLGPVLGEPGGSFGGNGVSRGCAVTCQENNSSTPPHGPPPPSQTEHTIGELLRQVQAQGSALENLTKKLEVVGVHGKARDEQISTLCWAEFEKLVAIQSKPQWVVHALDLFHRALIGVPPNLSEARCTRDWSTSAQGSFPAPEGASGCTDQRVPSAPASNEGEEPMTDMSSPFAAIVTSVLKIHGTQFRGGDVGPAQDTAMYRGVPK